MAPATTLTGTATRMPSRLSQSDRASQSRAPQSNRRRQGDLANPRTAEQASVVTDSCEALAARSSILPSAAISVPTLNCAASGQATIRPSEVSWRASGRGDSIHAAGTRDFRSTAVTTPSRPRTWRPSVASDATPPEPRRPKEHGRPTPARATRRRHRTRENCRPTARPAWYARRPGAAPEPTALEISDFDAQVLEVEHQALGRAPDLRPGGPSSPDTSVASLKSTRNNRTR